MKTEIWAMLGERLGVCVCVSERLVYSRKSLFTGPMYWIWNTVLRGEEATPPNQMEVWRRCKEAKNYFSSSLHALQSAIKKIQQSGHGLLENMFLYRGLSGGKLPSSMYTPNENGHLGVLPLLLV